MFDCLSGVAKAIECLSKYTSIFDLTHFDSIPRRELFSHNLSVVTILWWKELENTYTTIPCTWEAFVSAFHAKFVLPALVEVLMNEFINLKENELTMTEYVTKLMTY